MEREREKQICGGVHVRVDDYEIRHSNTKRQSFRISDDIERRECGEQSVRKGPVVATYQPPMYSLGGTLLKRST